MSVVTAKVCRKSISRAGRSPAGVFSPALCRRTAKVSQAWWSSRRPVRVTNSAGQERVISVSRSRMYVSSAAAAVASSGSVRVMLYLDSRIRSQLPSRLMSSSSRWHASRVRRPVTLSKAGNVCQVSARRRGRSRPAAAIRAAVSSAV